MKILVVSDIHGDSYYAREMACLFERELFDKMYLLGDLQTEAIQILNAYTGKIVAVRGNCDMSYDLDLARFNMPYLNYDYAFGKVIILTHGHYYNEYNIDQPYDILMMGHSHRSELRTTYEGRIIANPGSISRPRDFFHSYMVMDENGMKIYDFETHQVINEMRYNERRSA